MKATNLQVTVLIDKDVTRFLQIFVLENDHGQKRTKDSRDHGARLPRSGHILDHARWDKTEERATTSSLTRI